MILIQGGATLTFDVRLVRLNSAVWSDEVETQKAKKGKHLMVQVRNRKVLGWEEIYKPEVCEEMVGWEDELHMHYEATRLPFF